MASVDVMPKSSHGRSELVRAIFDEMAQLLSEDQVSVPQTEKGANGLPSRERMEVDEECTGANNEPGGELGFAMPCKSQFSMQHSRISVGALLPAIISEVNIGKRLPQIAYVVLRTCETHSQLEDELVSVTASKKTATRSAVEILKEVGNTVVVKRGRPRKLRHLSMRSAWRFVMPLRYSVTVNKAAVDHVVEQEKPDERAAQAKEQAADCLPKIDGPIARDVLLALRKAHRPVDVDNAMVLFRRSKQGAEFFSQWPEETIKKQLDAALQTVRNSSHCRANSKRMWAVGKYRCLQTQVQSVVVKLTAAKRAINYANVSELMLKHYDKTMQPNVLGHVLRLSGYRYVRRKVQSQSFYVKDTGVNARTHAQRQALLASIASNESAPREPEPGPSTSRDSALKPKEAWPTTDLDKPVQLSRNMARKVVDKLHSRNKPVTLDNAMRCFRHAKHTAVLLQRFGEKSVTQGLSDSLRALGYLNQPTASSSQLADSPLRSSDHDERYLIRLVGQTLKELLASNVKFSQQDLQKNVLRKTGVKLSKTGTYIRLAGYQWVETANGKHTYKSCVTDADAQLDLLVSQVAEIANQLSPNGEALTSVSVYREFCSRFPQSEVMEEFTLHLLLRCAGYRYGVTPDGKPCHTWYKHAEAQAETDCLALAKSSYDFDCTSSSTALRTHNAIETAANYCTTRKFTESVSSAGSSSEMQFNADSEPRFTQLLKSKILQKLQSRGLPASVQNVMRCFRHSSMYSQFVEFWGESGLEQQVKDAFCLA